MSNDIAYANAEFIPDAESYPPRWQAEAAAFREDMVAAGRARLDTAYGSGPRQRYDLFLPERARPEGVLIFVHGGYWRRFARTDWSHFAAGALARGWGVAMPGYTLAPEVRIADITREIAAAVTAIAAAVPGPIRLTGHSAGGHLVARMLCADPGLPSDVAARIETCTPISAVTDLRPLLDTAINDDLHLDLAEAQSESPALLPRALKVPVTVWVGAEERPAFLDQSRWLAEAWGAPLRIDPGRHHFDVIDGLSDADSPLMRAILGDHHPKP